MAKELESLITQNENGEIDCLSKRDEVDILLAEYNRLSRHAQMYVEQLSPRFTIFAVFVLSALAFAFQEPSHEIVYPIIPLFVFLLTSITAAQFHLIGMIDRRLRAIENRIKILNGGRAILEWESDLAFKHVYTYTVPGRLKGKWLSKGLSIIWNLTPQVLAVIFMVLSFLPLIGYSTYRAFFIIPKPWNSLYLIFISLCSFKVIIIAFSFFRHQQDFR